MSNEFLKLVMGLTPPGSVGRYHMKTLPDAQDRLVAFVLAYLADDDGAAVVSTAELASYTCLDPTAVGRAVKRNAQSGVVEIVRSLKPNGRNTYRLVRAKLMDRQATELMRRSGSVDVLKEYGVPAQWVNALHRAGLDSMDDLGERVYGFTMLPTAQSVGFHEYLKSRDDVRNVGPAVGTMLLEAFRKWEDDNAVSD